MAAGNVSLPMPTMQIDDMDAAVNDIEVISELERVMAEWCAALTDIIQGEADKHPTGSGPLAGQPCCPTQACSACFVVVELSLDSLVETLQQSVTMYMPYIRRSLCADHADTSDCAANLSVRDTAGNVVYWGCTGLVVDNALTTLLACCRNRLLESAQCCFCQLV